MTDMHAPSRIHTELLTEARACLSALKFEGAVAATKSALEIDPASTEANVLLAASLRELKRFGEAESIIVAALKQAPAHAGATICWAWIAHGQGLWEEAASRWARVRSLHPTLTDGYFGGGAALRHAGRLEDADKVYHAAFWSAPSQPQLLEGFASVAEQRGDWAEAARRWAVMTTMFPEHRRGHLGAAQSSQRAGNFDKADAAFEAALTRFKNDLSLLVAYAKCAEQSGRLDKALARWDIVATEYHSHAEGYVGAHAVLIQLGRIDDAQQVLLPAVRMFPENFDIQRANCWLANYAKDWPEAQRRWAQLCERFPDRLQAIIGSVAAFRDAGQFDKANGIADEGRAKFAHEYAMHAEWANIPSARSDFEESVRRTRIVAALFSDREAARTRLVEALVRAKQYDEAEEVLAEARNHFKKSFALAAAAAFVSAGRRDWPVAAERWRQALLDWPAEAAAHVGLSTALRELGEIANSDELLTTAAQRFPGNVEVKINLAKNRSYARDWRPALNAWAELKRAHPRHGGVTGGIADMLWQARQDLGALQTETGQAPFEIPAILEQMTPSGVNATEDMRALFMRFESLGDNCEFGIVQRRFGAEPLSLLRWTSTSPDKLVEALNDRMAGVGDPENTIVAISGGEYTTRDKRYHMFSHTFTPVASMPQDKFSEQQYRRMQFLRNKLLEDIAAGEKIYVYKYTKGMTLEQVKNIHDSLRRYGGRTCLLCVLLDPEAQKAGQVVKIEDGLFIGYAQRFSNVDIDVETWVKLCRGVAASWDDARGGADLQAASLQLS